jgi:hypothetical protein
MEIIMKKRISALVLVLVVLCVGVTGCGGTASKSNTLSGTYDYVENSGDNKIILLAGADSLTFEGVHVTYDGIVSEESRYAIIGDEFIMYFSAYGKTIEYSDDFRREDNSIFIGDSEWRKA